MQAVVQTCQIERFIIVTINGVIFTSVYYGSLGQNYVSIVIVSSW